MELDSHLLLFFLHVEFGISRGKHWNRKSSILNMFIRIIRDKGELPID